MRKRSDPNAWFQQALSVTEDAATSGWLKSALVEAINRDPVDAAGDAEVLSRILQLRVAAVQRVSVLPSNTARPTRTAP
jgi:hypothetical protein